MSRTEHEARSRIFAKLKTALADGASIDDRRTAVAQRIASPPQHPRPSRIDTDADGLRRLFRGFLEGQSATVIEVDSTADVPSAIAGYLRANNLAQRVRVGDDATLGHLPWEREPALERVSGAATATDETGLSHATAGVAETGTLVVMSGADNPVTLNFVPETHVVVLQGGDLVGAYEDAWARVRDRTGKGHMPRTVNFISGPSRTADIGGTLVTGAHGPRRLCVILTRA